MVEWFTENIKIDNKDKQEQRNHDWEQLQWIVQPQMMASVEKKARQDEDKAVAIAGVKSHTDVQVDNLLDKKLAKRGLKRSDMEDVFRDK